MSMFTNAFTRAPDPHAQAGGGEIDELEGFDVPMPAEMRGMDIGIGMEHGMEHRMEQDELDDLDDIELPPAQIQNLPSHSQYTQEPAPQTQSRPPSQTQTPAPAKSNHEGELPSRFPFSPVSSHVPTPPSLKTRIKSQMNEEDALDEFERFADDGAKDAGADTGVDTGAVEIPPPVESVEPPVPVEEEEEPEVDVDELARRFAQLEAEAAAKVMKFANEIIAHACELAQAVSAEYFASLQRTSAALAAGAVDIRKEEEMQRATMARFNEYLKFMEDAKKMFDRLD